MPRFFFDYYDRDIEATHDTEGTELENVAAAMVEASAALGEMTKEVLRHGGSEQSLQIRVRDEHGRSVGVCSMLFSASLLSQVN